MCISVCSGSTQDRTNSKMYKLIAISALLASVLAAEIHRNPEHLSTSDHSPVPVETHPVFNKPRSEEQHPVYKADINEGRERMAPGRGMGPMAKHDMLADEPIPALVDSNNAENVALTGFNNPVEVAYPDIPYAPGYSYGQGYASNGYDVYGNGLSDYLFEPDTSSMGLLWSQVPDSRTMVSYVGRTVSWVFSSIFVIMLGSLLTVGVCSYTNLCSITFNGVGPIHEEMRSLITPDRLEKISTAADFVKTAINKYQKIQQVAENVGAKKRRAA